MNELTCHFQIIRDESRRLKRLNWIVTWFFFLISKIISSHEWNFHMSISYPPASVILNGNWFYCSYDYNTNHRFGSFCFFSSHLRSCFKVVFQVWEYGISCFRQLTWASSPLCEFGERLTTLFCQSVLSGPCVLLFIL